MKNMKKILVLALAAVLLVAVGVGGTLAWLQDSTQTIENTFTTSNIDIELKEEPDAGEDNKASFQMIPDADIDKKPYVTVKKDSVACWVFVEVIESSVLDNYISYSVDNEEWTALGESYPNIYYKKIDTAPTTDKNCDILTDDKVSVLAAVTEDDMAKLKEENAVQPTLTFKAYAIQYEGFNDDTKTDAENAVNAWTEIKNRTDNKATTTP